MPRARPGQIGPAWLKGAVTIHAFADRGSLEPGLHWMFFLCCFFACLMLLVSALAGAIIGITGSDVAYMASDRSLIANLLMLPSG